MLQRRHKFGEGRTNTTKNNNLTSKNNCIRVNAITYKAEDMAVTFPVVAVDPVCLSFQFSGMLFSETVSIHFSSANRNAVKRTGNLLQTLFSQHFSAVQLVLLHSLRATIR